MYPAAAPKNHDPQSWNGISYDSVVRAIERDLSDDGEDEDTLVMHEAHPGHHAPMPRRPMPVRPVLPRISHTTNTTSLPAVAATPSPPAKKKRRWSLWMFVATVQIAAIGVAVVLSNPSLRTKTVDETNAARARVASWIAPPSHAADPGAVAPASAPPAAQELPPASPPAPLATCEAPATPASAAPIPTTRPSRHTTAHRAAQSPDATRGGDDVGEPVDPAALLDRGLGASAP